MMYRILLVDDESIDLEWLKRRVSGYAETLDVAGAATSAFAALEVLQERPVDILLTDIRMPIMSGLELAARAKQLQPAIKIAFVSGHDDFDYAKQAIKVNAGAYLLKPVDDGELYDTLRELSRQLDEERQLAEAGKQLQETLPLIERELLLGWLEGATTGQAERIAQAALQLLGSAPSMAVALVEIDDWERTWCRQPEERQHELAAGLFAALESACGERRIGICVRDKRHGMAIVSGCGREELLAFAGEWVEAVRSRFGATVTVGVGGHVRQPDELRASYGQARQALKDKLFLGKNRVIAHIADKPQAGGGEIDLDAASLAMFQDMREYRLLAIDDGLEKLFREAEQFGEKATIIHLVVQFISRLHMHCQQLNENLFELLHWEQVQLNVMFQFETIHDMKSWLRRQLFELSELLYVKSQKMSRKIIDSILAYIDSRLEAKLTLKEVAGHFEFSPNYLGQLFKEETGEHFSDYLIRARINRSCELLLDPMLKVYEIADRMGYKNILYFNRQFKTVTGMTPGDYRKRHKV